MKMTNLLNKMVEVTEMNVIGMAVDVNELGTTLWVDTNTDWVPVPLHMAKEVVVAAPKAETVYEEFEAMLAAADMSYDAYSEGDSATYCIEGSLYSVMVTISEDGFHHCETTHKERMERESDVFNAYGDTESAYANTATRKTLKGAFNYAKKWSDK
jgi:hypothetical protein